MQSLKKYITLWYSIRACPRWLHTSVSPRIEPVSHHLSNIQVRRLQETTRELQQFTSRSIVRPTGPEGSAITTSCDQVGSYQTQPCCYVQEYHLYVLYIISSRPITALCSAERRCSSCHMFLHAVFTCFTSESQTLHWSWRESRSRLLEQKSIKANRNHKRGRNV